MNVVILFFSTYIFLLSALYFMLWWIVLFVSFRKNWAVRKKILIASALSAIIFPFIERLTLTDWWSPIFLWNTFFHFEDALFGFAITGTALGIYFWVSRSTRATIERQAVFSALHRNCLLITTICSMFILFYLLHISSFYAGVVCMTFLPAYVFVRIPRMALSAIFTGILLTSTILPGYFVATYLHPGWIQEYWKLAGWPGQLLLTVPIGEYVFYFLSGLFIPAFAEVLFAKGRSKI